MIKSPINQIIIISIVLVASYLLFAKIQNPVAHLNNQNGFYIVKSSEKQGNTLISSLEYNGTDTSYLKDYNNIIKKLTLQITEDNENQISFKIIDSEKNRFTLPYKEPFPYTKNQKKDKNVQNLYTYKLAEVNEIFSLEIRRNSDNTIIFQSTGFYYTDQYLMIQNNMQDSQHLYGLGERRNYFKLQSGEFNLFTKDVAGTLGVENTYGHHPMYLSIEKNSGNSHVSFMRNVSPMKINYQEKQSLQYNIISGIIELVYFINTENSSPENVIKLYHAYINGYTLHPFWSQGWHQCRYGYKGSDQLKSVWEQYNSNQIPIDTLWTDIDYMDAYADFTIDTQKFDPTVMNQIIDRTKPEGLHWVPIIDVGIAQGSDAYERGKNMDIYVKSAYTNSPLVGKVWPGLTSYPDFNHPNSTAFWSEGLMNITKNYNVTPSGIWIDMNEFSNFIPGEKDHTDDIDLPYKLYEPMNQQTLSLNAYQYHEKDANYISQDQKITQLDWHNLNGFGEGLATHAFLKSVGHKQTFILSRSTAFGQGAYTQHWGGDNVASWDHLHVSISEIMNFNLFGIPLTGVDICGFIGDSNAELCARWMQAGSLYPFARNHNDINSKDQEPFAFPNDSYVLSSSIKSLKLRYSLLKHYYHLFLNKVGTVFRPLFFEFKDPVLYSLDTQFMIGDSLMAAPVLAQGDSVSQVTAQTIVIPQKSVFYDYYEGQKADRTFTKNTPFDSPPSLFIREGKTIAVQDVTNVLRSRDLNNKFSLNIAFDNELFSNGTMMGISNFEEENIQNNCQNQNCIVNVSCQGLKIKSHYEIQVTFEGNVEKIVIERLNIYGIGNNIVTVSLQQNWVVDTSTNLNFKAEFFYGEKINMKDKFLAFEN